MKNIFFLYFFAISSVVCAQKDVIFLENPSFEDEPRAGLQPSGWFDAGFPGESAPDVQPFGGFGVTQSAQDKNTYLGMVVRDNKTWESVSQKLVSPLKREQCYKFSIYLAKSDEYVSYTKTDMNQLTNFDRGVVLKIYGGNNIKNKAELLAVSDLVDHTDWKKYDFEFTPKNTYTFLTLEAYYKTPTMFYYNGNLLLDNASPIYSCKIPDPILADKNVKTDNKLNQLKNQIDSPKTEISKEIKEENRGVFKSDLKASDLKIGYTFQLENLYFKADSSNITRNAERVLFKLLQFLNNNPKVSIEIGGHTNGLPPHEYCDRLSSDRAKNVSEFLIKNGINKRRISFKGYGKRKPIADNKTEDGKQKNQRVEIKITDLD